MYKTSYAFENGQEFRVLCLTKREDFDGIGGKNAWHVPACPYRSGTAEAKVKVGSNGGFLILFQGKEYSFRHVRNGLDGRVLVIGMHNHTEKPYTVWELCTDTPSPEPDLGKLATPDEIWRIATLTIGHKFLSDHRWLPEHR